MRGVRQKRAMLRVLKTPGKRMGVLRTRERRRRICIVRNRRLKTSGRKKQTSDPGVENPRLINRRLPDAGAPKARLHRMRRTLGGTPLSRVLQHSALRECRRHLPSVGRLFLCRVLKTPGSARAPKTRSHRVRRTLGGTPLSRVIYCMALRGSAMRSGC